MFNKRSKVLILGAKGNLGQQLINVFNNEVNVIGLDKEQIDITNEELIKNKIINIRPDLIVNAAAYNAVDKCEENPEEYQLAKNINGLAPGYITKAALDVGAALVHYSSDYVFDGLNSKGYLEKDVPKPINKYGESKLLGEKEILKQVNSGLKWYIIRTSKLFGPKGESDQAKDSFFDIMLKLGKEKDELRLVDEEMSCFTYTPDLAKATKELVNGKLGCGIYHLSNLIPCTWYEATVELFKQSKIDIKLVPILSEQYPRPAKRPNSSILLNNKFPQLRSYKEALKDYLREI